MPKNNKVKRRSEVVIHTIDAKITKYVIEKKQNMLSTSKVAEGSELSTNYDEAIN